MAEHSLIFPIDTAKTLMQTRAPALAGVGGGAGGDGVGAHGMFASFAQLQSQGGMPRMWRGVQTMFTGCIPAHAAYFTLYEGTKAKLAGPAGQESGAAPFAAGLAVALSTMVHDVIMTPMDCIKQRLQLGHHQNSIYSCACSMMRHEGPQAFMLSYPTTLLMNVPYAMIMGSANEALRGVLNPRGEHSLSTYIAAGAGAGMLAAAATNPLDVIKTRLQTQHLELQTRAVTEAAAAVPGPPCPRSPVAPTARQAYTGMVQAGRAVFREEGYAGFGRGVTARMLMHAPSVAICWTTYETVKHTLTKYRLFE